jgi:polyisoprenoid-binding protein YceI
MKKNLLLLVVLSSSVFANAQKYFSKNATLSFLNKNKVENIEATNKSGTIAIDAKTGVIAFNVLIKSFTFENALMQQHFNDNYMESGKFPKAEFKGTITNNAAVNYTVDGSYTAKVAGKLTMHGVTKDVTTNATITVKGGKVSASASLNFALKDYKISTEGVGSNVTLNINTGNLTLIK